jgi:hypothetical protein
MRLHYAVALLLAVCLAESANGRHAMRRRQDSTDAATTTNKSAAQTSQTQDASTTLTSAASSSGSPQPSKSTSPSIASTERATTISSSASITTRSATDAASAITLSSSPAPTANASVTAPDTKDMLPIAPRITPALGITGVILMVAGVALCLIGIKHQWLHVFLSTAFLTGLAVTVLIIYVMNPPVKDAIQGAYMVAAVLTGLIFGALALIFTEVTEGLGCLLGGFCLGMWFLVLSPGGLIGSTTGRAIMIAVFCMVAFALYFSQYTRTYGLIVCTAFAGAQISILGIDCFSRAGLKEFWLYIWSESQPETTLPFDFSDAHIRPQQRHLPSEHPHVPHHTWYSSGDCMHGHNILVRYDVAIQDLEVGEAEESKEGGCSYVCE